MARKKVLAAIAAAVGVAAIAGGATISSLARRAREPVDAPFPPIRPATSPEALARGEAIVRAVCASCHAPPGEERLSGAPMPDVPEAFGTFYSRNITRHPTAGIGGLSDGAVARMIRYGVSSQGRRSVMPEFSMGDDDLAAVLGFLRSDHPLVAPSDKPSVPTTLTTTGALVVYLSTQSSQPRLPPVGVPTPAPTPTAEYGRYAAYSLYGCVDCHTPGFDGDKVHGRDAFAGGFVFRGSDGREIPSANLTRDATGLYLWSYADFRRALRDGLRPDGTAVRYPMPRFRIPEVEIRALWELLRKVPRRQSHLEGVVPIQWERRIVESTEPAPAAPASTAAPSVPAPELAPAQLFVSLGCQACHAPGAAFHAQFVAGRTKPAAKLAQWIRHPEEVKPGTAMPTFASRLTEAQALRLAEWIRRTPPEKLPGLTSTR